MTNATTHTRAAHSSTRAPRPLDPGHVAGGCRGVLDDVGASGASSSPSGPARVHTRGSSAAAMRSHATAYRPGSRSQCSTMDATVSATDRRTAARTSRQGRCWCRTRGRAPRPGRVPPRGCRRSHAVLRRAVEVAPRDEREQQGREHGDGEDDGGAQAQHATQVVQHGPRRERPHRQVRDQVPDAVEQPDGWAEAGHAHTLPTAAGPLPQRGRSAARSRDGTLGGRRTHHLPRTCMAPTPLSDPLKQLSLVHGDAGLVVTVRPPGGSRCGAPSSPCGAPPADVCGRSTSTGGRTRSSVIPRRRAAARPSRTSGPPTWRPPAWTTAGPFRAAGPGRPTPHRRPGLHDRVRPRAGRPPGHPRLRRPRGASRTHGRLAGDAVRERRC